MQCKKLNRWVFMSYDDLNLSTLTVVFNDTLEGASLDTKRNALFSLIHIAELFDMVKEGSESDDNLTQAVVPFFTKEDEVSVTFEWTLTANEISMREYYLLRTKGFIGRTPEGVYVL